MNTFVALTDWLANKAVSDAPFEKPSNRQSEATASARCAAFRFICRNTGTALAALPVTSAKSPPGPPFQKCRAFLLLFVSPSPSFIRCPASNVATLSPARTDTRRGGPPGFARRPASVGAMLGGERRRAASETSISMIAAPRLVTDIDVGKGNISGNVCYLSDRRGGSAT